jgi:hypothetical protein
MYLALIITQVVAKAIGTQAVVDMAVAVLGFKAEPLILAAVGVQTKTVAVAVLVS